MMKGKTGGDAGLPSKGSVWILASSTGEHDVN